MKKFLKRTVAVLLTVCLMASVLVPVSVAAEATEYKFAKTAITAEGGFVTAANGSFSAASTTPFSSRNDGLRSNVYNEVHWLVFKLNGISAVAGNKYNITFTDSTATSVNKAFVYLINGGATIDGADLRTSLAGLIGDPIGQLNANANTTFNNVDLTNYISNGSIYVAVKGESTAKTRLHITTISVEGVVAPKAASVSVDYNTAWGDYLNVIEGTQNDGENPKMQDLANGFAHGDVNAMYVGDWTASSIGGYIVRNNYSDARVRNFNGVQVNTGLNGYFALKIKAPAAGTYTLSVDMYATYKGNDFYFIPESVVTNALTDIPTLITDTTYFKGTADMSNGTNSFSEIEVTEAYYYVVIKTTTNARVYLSGFSLTSTTQYETLAAAAAAATTKFHTVKLLKDYSDAIVVNGYTLDLNGNNVTGNVVATNGNVIDSTDGTGSVSGTLQISGDNNGYVPLKDGSSWRIFNCDGVITFSIGGGVYETNPVVSGDYVLMWFDLRFTNAAAYTLIASGNSGLSVGAALTVNGNLLTDNITFTNTVKGWAGADHAAGDQAMGVRIADAAAAGNDGTITVEFSYETTAGAASQIDFTGLTYTVPTAE